MGITCSMWSSAPKLRARAVPIASAASEDDLKSMGKRAFFGPDDETSSWGMMFSCQNKRASLDCRPTSQGILCPFELADDEQCESFDGCIGRLIFSPPGAAECNGS